MAGRSQDRLGSSILPIQDGFHGKLGREDGVGRGETLLSGIEGSISDESTDTVAALLGGMQDVQGSACFENETEFRFSRCIRQGGVEAPVLWGRVAKYVWWEAEKQWKARGWGLALGEKYDNEFVLRCTRCVDNSWPFVDSKEKLECMVKDITEELLDLDMEPKPESLWWKSTHQDEDGTTLKVGNRPNLELDLHRRFRCAGTSLPTRRVRHSWGGKRCATVSDDMTVLRLS